MVVYHFGYIIFEYKLQPMYSNVNTSHSRNYFLHSNELILCCILKKLSTKITAFSFILRLTRKIQEGSACTPFIYSNISCISNSYKFLSKSSVSREYLLKFIYYVKIESKISFSSTHFLLVSSL
jgi:hypothetical protein